MKKSILTLAFLVFFAVTSTNAQAILGENLYQKISKPSYYLLLNQDDKDVIEDLKTFTKSPKLSEPTKNMYRIDKPMLSGFASEIGSIDVVFENSKRVLKTVFFFFDKNQKALENSEANMKAEAKFVNDFSNFTNKSLLVRLADNQSKIDQDNFDEAKKDVSKIEKRIANNLEDQEKLGKKLDQSPDLIARALAEKKDLVSKAYGDSTNAINGAMDSNLLKASSKKEKEISKLQKDADKASTKLDKKEKDLEQLKTDLINAKTYMAEMEKVSNKAIENLNLLKK